MNFDEAIALVSAISGKLKISAQEKRDIALLLACTSNVEPSAIHDYVLCNRVMIPVQVKTCEDGASRLKFTDVDTLDLVQEYYQI